MPFRLEGLWRHPDFLKLWSGRTVSGFGSQITFLALPLTAILVLDATPLQMGILSAVGSVPSLILGLGVGVWVDRWRKRPVLIATDYGRALLLLAIPIAAVFNVLCIEHLYAFALGVGVMGLFFGVASRSMLPSLVSRDQLVEANSKLAIGGSAADVAGPGVAGVLIQTVTAPIALIVDAITFAVSALAIGLIRAQEPEPLRDQNAGGFFSEARQSLALIWRNRVLLAIAGAIGGIEIFNSMLEAVWLLYVNKVLGIEPSAFGLMFSVSGAGFVLGAFFAAWFIRRVGTGRAMIVGVLVAGLSDLATPLAGGPFVAVVALLTAAQFSFAMGATVYGIAQVSIRQAATPLRLQGRMNGVMSAVQGGLVPVGALIGGVLGQTIGMRPTLFLSAGGELAAVLWLLVTPIWSKRDVPEAKNA